MPLKLTESVLASKHKHSHISPPPPPLPSSPALHPPVCKSASSKYLHFVMTAGFLQPRRLGKWPGGGGGTWRPPASDSSVASLFLISARRRHLLFQYFRNNDRLSKQQCNYQGWIYHAGDQCAARCGRLRADGPPASCSGISWISESPPAASPPLCSALGWAKGCTVQLLQLAHSVVASCLSVSKQSSGCVATPGRVIACLPDAPPGPPAV